MLSQKTKYALQALAFLSTHYKQDSPILSGVIAERKKIPLNFLENILYELRNVGILKSVRGKNGGYVLAEHPGKTPISKVIHLMDGPIALLSCASLHFHKPCDNCELNTCGLNSIMAEARDVILKVLDKRTLWDIRDRKNNADALVEKVERPFTNII